MKYLHLGQSTVVPDTEILGIFDTDNATSSHVTRKFLRLAEQQGQVVDVSGELPKSFVLAAPKTGGEPTVYLSQLMSATLLRRSESPGFRED